MGKVLKIAAIVGAIAVAFVPGVGAALSGVLVSAMGGTFASVGIAAGIVGAVSTLGVMSALGMASKALGLGPKSPKASSAATDRLNASINPLAARKIWFGTTAGNTDVLYQEFHGTDQDHMSTVIALASHKVQSIDQIWFDEEMAWSAASGVTSKYAGYLTVALRTEGSAANAMSVGSGSSWSPSTARATGLAYVVLTYKLTGNSKKQESPFGASVTNRITIRGKGALIYDPRLDDTVGGSGSHRAANQATWSWDDNAANNPAVQLLWYLLGWKINGKLAVGLGLPPERIDITSFITAANMCDEVVTKSIGGTEPRYRSAGVFSENDDPGSVIENLLATCAGTLRDAGGKLSLSILHNDLAFPVIDLTDADVIGDFTWLQSPPSDQKFNIVQGRYTNATSAALYQPVDYPPVRIASFDGIDRFSQLELLMVQSASQAQRLAKQKLQRAQYPATFAADFMAAGWRVQLGDPVRLTFPALGMSNKLFRVVEHGVMLDGRCPMVLVEEHDDIYAWDAEEAAEIEPRPPISYDPLNNPLVQALDGVDDAVLAALALATAKGKLWLTPTIPSISSSFVGDSWLNPATGEMYERVDEAGVDLNGTTIVLEGFRPRIGWTLSATQVIRDTLVTANVAYADANTAIDGLIGLADDAFLSPLEKKDILLPKAEIVDIKYGVLAAQATAFGISGELISATAKRAAWLSFLSSVVPAYTDITVKSPVDRTAYNLARDEYDNALYVLDQSIKAKVATLATWAGVSGTGKPEDNATRNVPRGTYSAGETYAVGDLVHWGSNGSGYIRIGSGSTTDVPPSDGSKWALFVAAGVDGIDGIDGVDGVDGTLTEFVFKRAAAAPATPTGNGIPAGWSDNPPAGSDPLWWSRAKQQLDGTLIGAWSTPIIDGDDRIYDGLNPDGTVATDKVNADSVENDTLVTGAYASGSGGTMSAGGTTDGVSVAYTCQGGRVRVMICVDAFKSAGATLTGYLRIIRNKSGTDTLLGRPIYIYQSTGGFNPTLYFVNDSPGAGAVTYRIQYTRDSGSGSLAYGNEEIDVEEQVTRTS